MTNAKKPRCGAVLLCAAGGLMTAGRHRLRAADHCTCGNPVGPIGRRAREYAAVTPAAAPS